MITRLALVRIAASVVLAAGAGAGAGACKRDGASEREAPGGSAPAAPAIAGKEARMRTYTIQYFGKPALPPVTVTAEIPAAWTETVSAGGAPSFAIPGNTGTPPTITAIGIARPDDAARIEMAMELQYGTGTPDVTRTPLDGGRVWAVRKEPSVVHARMFLPTPDGVVMAVAIVKHAEADRLAEIEAAFRTVRVVEAAP
ncbi:MAG TPA: hypothetical protein VK932_23805 [Kofleriaceae bacterium]|nr:hypothetical protein [Kofleriaceae bacterium]